MSSNEVVVIEPLAVKKGTAAKMLDVGLTTIYKLCHEGKLKTTKIGADDRVLVSSIKAYASGVGK